MFDFLLYDKKTNCSLLLIDTKTSSLLCLMLIQNVKFVPMNDYISKIKQIINDGDKNLKYLLTSQSPTLSHIWLEAVKIKVEKKRIVVVFILISLFQWIWIDQCFNKPSLSDLYTISLSSKKVCSSLLYCGDLILTILMHK